MPPEYTVSFPPVRTAVLLATPPAETYSTPPLETTVLLATPPETRCHAPGRRE
jgi:hypothetical protein